MGRLTLPPLLTRIVAVVKWLASTAQWRGVLSNLSRGLMVWPSTSNCRTNSMLFAAAASWSGVVQKTSTGSTYSIAWILHIGLVDCMIAVYALPIQNLIYLLPQYHETRANITQVVATRLLTSSTDRSFQYDCAVLNEC